MSARARSLRVSDEPAERASVSDRCAVNLAGVSLEQVARGDWLVAPSTLAPSRHVVIALKVLDDFPRSVRHWLPIHVYHAASHAEGHVALLETTRVGAGQSALVELVLDTPLHPKYGDRLIVRDAARELTIGGGAVIDTVSPQRGRRAPARIARLQAQRAEDPVVALRTLLANDDVELEAFKRSRNLTDAALTSLLGAVDPVQLQRDGRTVLVSRDGWQSTLEALCAQISAYHKSAPHSPGLKADQIRRTGIVPKRWLDDALAALVSQHRVSESGGHFHDPAHRPALPPDDAALLKRIEAIIGEGDRPPSIGDIAKTLATPLRPLDGFVARMSKLGLLVRVGDNRVLLSRHVDSLSATRTGAAPDTTGGIFGSRISRCRAHRPEFFDRRARILRPLRLHTAIRRSTSHRGLAVDAAPVTGTRWTACLAALLAVLGLASGVPHADAAPIDVESDRKDAAHRPARAGRYPVPRSAHHPVDLHG